MVKGVAKYAVVVRGTGVDGFSDAIFISDGVFDAENGVSNAQEMLSAARRIACGGVKPGKKLLPLAAAFVSGCVFSALSFVLWYNLIK